MRRGTRRLAIAMLVATAMATGHSGLAVERLQGAWATGAASCDQVFAMRFDPELPEVETSYHRCGR